MGEPQDISRSAIIERAESWLRPHVPHSPTRFHQNEHGIYRTDAAGYVSMAWGLPGVPLDRAGGHDVRGLLDVSVDIHADDLLAGDAVISDPDRVVLFHEWTDDTRTAYWGFEQAARGTCHLRVDWADGDRARRYLRLRCGTL